MRHGRGYFPHEAMSDGDMRAAWELHADDLRAEWAENNPPGTRCFAELFCEIVPRYGERATTQWWSGQHELHREKWLLHGILDTHCWPDLQEPEHEFLFRVGYIGKAEYLETKTLYDASHEGDAEFLAGVTQRAEKWERERRQRLCHAAQSDGGDDEIS